MGEAKSGPALLFRILFGVLAALLLALAIVLGLWNAQRDSHDPLYGLGVRFDTTLTCQRSPDRQMHCVVTDNYCAAYHTSKAIIREIPSLNQVQKAKMINSLYLQTSKSFYEHTLKDYASELQIRSHGDLLIPTSASPTWYLIQIDTLDVENIALFGTIFPEKAEKIVNKINFFIQHADESVLHVSALAEAISTGLHSPTGIHPCPSE
jgi:hypothetical protein